MPTQVNNSPELPEFPLVGPFGGIQSEMPIERIEQNGFADTLNVMFRKSELRVRPQIGSLVAMPNPQEAWVGVADFYDSTGTHRQVAMTPTRLLWYNNGAWTAITGALSGTPTQKFSWTVVGQKLCFCQGIDKVKLWDGLAGAFVDSSANSVPAKYMAELDRHLLVGSTVEAGVNAYQRVRWTGAGDATDWTSANAGQLDLFNDLGPINGIIKLYQYGYIFQQKGIVQVIPTGIGTNPFQFVSLSSSARGLSCPYSLAVNGEMTAYYVGKDNVYMFDGTQSSPVGDMPLSGRQRLGARKRILADLQGADPQTIWGYISTSINGNDFNAYWLVIPNVCIWVYNIDEMNWTRWTTAKTVNVIGNFDAKNQIRIMDLVGRISDQQWSPSSLTNNNPFDSTFIGFSDGTPGIFDFSGWSEQAWSLATGYLAMGNWRQHKAVKKVRIGYKDNGPCTVAVQVMNDKGLSDVAVTHGQFADTNTIVLNGSGSGLPKSQVLGISIEGLFHQITVSGAAGVPFELTELTPIYSLGGERKTQ